MPAGKKPMRFLDLDLGTTNTVLTQIKWQACSNPNHSHHTKSWYGTTVFSWE